MGLYTNSGMDFYRFFLPQHNPRLLSVAPRQIELVELEQISTELLKAVGRLKTRSTRSSDNQAKIDYLTTALTALTNVVEALGRCCDDTPADTDEQLLDIVRERSSYPGWEQWTALVLEQFANSPAFESLRQSRLDRPLVKRAA